MLRLSAAAAAASILVALAACERSEADPPAPPPDLPYVWSDGFEAPNATVDDLLARDGSRWTNVQLVHPSGGTNVLEPQRDRVREGEAALRIVAQPADDILSKAGIEKGGFFAPEGASVTLAADVYLAGAPDLRELFLIDLECCSCWDPDVPDNQCPGIRLKLAGDGPYLAVERGKILGSTLRQDDTPFPTDRWVRITWELDLSTEDAGATRVLLDGVPVLERSGYNLPVADALRAAFAAEGIDFELTQPVGYERFQIGATANPTSSTVELYVDDVEVRVE